MTQRRFARPSVLLPSVALRPSGGLRRGAHTLGLCLLAAAGSLAQATTASPVVRPTLPSAMTLLPGMLSAAALPNVQGAALPDLTVDLTVPGGRLRPGATAQTDLKLIVRNIGTGTASGSRPGVTGYMVDLILSSDAALPAGLGYAATSPAFREDMLLTGGRVSNTPDVPRGGTVQVAEGSLTLPADLRPGNYFLCAKVNVGERIRESNTTNNTVCKPFTYGPAQGGKPDLIVTGASVKFSGICRPGNIWATANVTVRNIGTAPSPAVLDKGILQVVDYRDVSQPSGYRGQGVGLAGLAPGESRTVSIPVAYPVGDTGYDGTGYSGKVVSYFARVNFGGWIDEANTANNRMAERIAFTPTGCP